ncbi:MAG: hypothetical protein K1X72_19795 [Pyrinomonadaceae bacterium]|nr:hypothetical protein [Pyrinomonadaceae bacterium]
MKKTILFWGLILTLTGGIFAQSAKNQAIFAVLNDGKTLEPIAKVENGKLIQTVSGGDDEKIIKAFNATYYKPKTVYSLIFGGKVAGTSTVVKSDPNAECSRNMADVFSKSGAAKLKGFVMALATNIKLTKTGSGVRRLPTPAERTEIEKLVVTEFSKNKVNAKALRSHNLTALDVDGDGKIEFVGTYWVANAANERALLFFIADKRTDKYALNYSEFRTVKKEEVMSQDLKDVDTGVYHELLLEILDYNNDGVAEVFTYVQSFEGAGFNAYQRVNGKWERALEASNYHCAY